MKLRLWPDALFGRLALILVIGMFGGQLLTSTIWFETHDNRTLEIPSRLFASRFADTLRLLQSAPDQTAQQTLVHQLDDAAINCARSNRLRPCRRLWRPSRSGRRKTCWQVCLRSVCTSTCHCV